MLNQPKAEDVAASVFAIQEHLEDLDYDLPQEVVRQAAGNPGEVLQRAFELQEVYGKRLDKSKANEFAKKLTDNWPRALRRATREEAEA